MYISHIKLVFLSGVETEVTQLALPLVGNSFRNLKEVMLICSDGSNVSFDYNSDSKDFVDKEDYAVIFNERYSSLFGHAVNEDYYYFVSYSSSQYHIYNNLELELEYKTKPIGVDVQNGYIKWTSEENSPSNKTKLVAERIDNGVIVPLNNITPKPNLFNFDYLNIVEVIKTCILFKKSGYIRLGWYDEYVSTKFRCSSAIIKNDVPDKRLLRISLVTYDGGSEEIFNSFKVKEEAYSDFSTSLMKLSLAGIRHRTIN